MARLLFNVLNEANPNRIADAAREVYLGSALGNAPRNARVAVVAGTGVGALPEDAKAAAVLRCFVTAGTVTGHFTALQTAAAPATTQVGVSPTGNLQFLIADAVTEAEVTYVTAEGIVRQETISVASQIGVLPTGIQAKTLLSATDVTGGGSVAKTVVARSNAPAASSASISIDGDTIRFGDAGVTSALVRYIAWPAETVDQALRSSVNF